MQRYFYIIKVYLIEKFQIKDFEESKLLYIYYMFTRDSDFISYVHLKQKVSLY